jgi:hypothetical protein
MSSLTIIGEVYSFSFDQAVNLVRANPERFHCTLNPISFLDITSVFQFGPTARFYYLPGFWFLSGSTT